tara:strand:- start:1908 stop:2279 length:372 start_codon:yes stop_codon:yes gene_type:complete
MKNQKHFGIKSITINGTSINTVNIRVNNTPFNANALAHLRGLDVNLITNPTLAINRKTGKVSERIEICYTGMNYAYDSLIIKAIGLALKSIKLNNIDEQYNWCDYKPTEADCWDGDESDKFLQ